MTKMYKQLICLCQRSLCKRCFLCSVCAEERARERGEIDKGWESKRERGGWRKDEREREGTGIYWAEVLRYDSHYRAGSSGQAEDTEVTHSGTWPHRHSLLAKNTGSVQVHSTLVLCVFVCLYVCPCAAINMILYVHCDFGVERLKVSWNIENNLTFGVFASNQTRMFDNVHILLIFALIWEKLTFLKWVV